MNVYDPFDYVEVEEENVVDNVEGEEDISDRITEPYLQVDVDEEDES